MNYAKQRLVVLDADGTTINAFDAIGKTFAHHNMGLGDLVRFQKRHNIFKYLGGLKEFPINLRQQINKKKRKALIKTLTEIYREEGELYAGIAGMIEKLVTAPSLRVGVVSRNITLEPLLTLRQVFKRNDVDPDAFDFFDHLPLKEDKIARFRSIREHFNINPARACACGDEKNDFLAATGAGMHPFMVSYGFESFARLEKKIGVPPELISNSPAELRQRLLHASWCGHVATLFPNDTRNIRCSKTLYELATAVKDLPPTHVLFFKLAQIDRVDEGAYLRWLDELRLEMSYIGHLLAESVEVAIQRLIEITDASLTEWRQSTVNLH
jgi:phosphoglycolate phosphatase